MSRIFLSIFLTLVNFNKLVLADTISCVQLFGELETQKAQLIQMLPQYIGEEKGHYYDKTARRYWNVHYFNHEDLKHLTITVKNSTLYDFKNEKYSTEFDHENGVFKEALVVLTAEENLLILPYESRGLYHHSSLSHGKPVLFAGTITVANGQVIELTDLSGHYKPNLDSLKNFITFLESKKLNLRNMLISGFNVFQKTKQHSISYSEFKNNF